MTGNDAEDEAVFSAGHELVLGQLSFADSVMVDYNTIAHQDSVMQKPSNANKYRRGTISTV